MYPRVALETYALETYNFSQEKKKVALETSHLQHTTSDAGKPLPGRTQPMNNVSVFTLFSILFHKCNQDCESVLKC